MLCSGASSILENAEVSPYTTLGNIGAYTRIMEIATRHGVVKNIQEHRKISRNCSYKTNTLRSSRGLHGGLLIAKDISPIANRVKYC